MQYYSKCSSNSTYNSYKGPIYSKPGITLDKRILYETENIGLSYHVIQFDENSDIIDDWIYFIKHNDIAGLAVLKAQVHSLSSLRMT